MTPNADNPHDTEDDGPTAEEVESAERPRRSLWGLVALIVVAAVVLVALMLLRDCGGSTPEDSGGEGKVIEAVDGMDPVDGVISLWIAQGVDLEILLSAAGVDDGGRTDLGEGRWVIEVPEGSESRAVSALRTQDGVHDAGRVYER